MSRLQPPEYTSFIAANHILIEWEPNSFLLKLLVEMAELKERLTVRKVGLGDWNYHGDYVKVRDELLRRYRK